MRDFYLWSFRFDLTVYAPGQMRTMPGFFGHLAKVMHGFYRDSTAYFYLGIAGLLVVVGVEVRSSFQDGFGYLARSAVRHAIIIAPLVYLGFCMINMQSGPDLIPLLPFVAVFAALALIRLTELLGRAINRVPGTNRRRFEAGAAVLLVGVVLYKGAGALLAVEKEVPRLKDQRSMVAEIVSLLLPGDKIFVLGRSEVLVLSGLTNASRYFYLDRGKDRFLDQVEPGGFDGWLAGLKEQRPRVVVLDRLGSMDLSRELEDWVKTDYRVRRSGVFFYYVRKDNAP